VNLAGDDEGVGEGAGDEEEGDLFDLHDGVGGDGRLMEERSALWLSGE